MNNISHVNLFLDAANGTSLQIIILEYIKLQEINFLSDNSCSLYAKRFNRKKSSQMSFIQCPSMNFAMKIILTQMH